MSRAMSKDAGRGRPARRQRRSLAQRICVGSTVAVLIAAACLCLWAATPRRGAGSAGRSQTAGRKAGLPRLPAPNHSAPGVPGKPDAPPTAKPLKAPARDVGPPDGKQPRDLPTVASGARPCAEARTSVPREACEVALVSGLAKRAAAERQTAEGEGSRAKRVRWRSSGVAPADVGKAALPWAGEEFAVPTLDFAAGMPWRIDEVCRLPFSTLPPASPEPTIGTLAETPATTSAAMTRPAVVVRPAEATALRPDADQRIEPEPAPQPPPEKAPSPRDGFDFASRPVRALTIDTRHRQGDLPPDHGRAALAQMQAADGGESIRTWPLVCYGWEAPGLCHHPLYFEEVNLERLGYSPRCLGPVQPVLSGVHFFATVPTLPYRLFAEPPRCCQYTLGHHRPGSDAPYAIYLPPWSPRGGIAEAALATGLIFAIP